jgi:hypothetical protein
VIYSQPDNLSQEDLAIFGYRPGISNFGYMLEPNREFWYVHYKLWSDKQLNISNELNVIYWTSTQKLHMLGTHAEQHEIIFPKIL